LALAISTLIFDRSASERSSVPVICSTIWTPSAQLAARTSPAKAAKTINPRTNCFI
jgi:hypothetical protein